MNHVNALMINAYKKPRLIVFIFLSLIVGYTLFVKFLTPLSWVYSSEVTQSSRFIQGIEDFRLQNSRVPTEEEASSLKEILGLPTGMQCPCYQVEGDNHYSVWFGASLGSSYVFDSISKEWQKTG